MTIPAQRLTFTTPPSLTLEHFAKLRPAWPYTDLDHSGGILLARIHPRHNRPKGDEQVLARALVYVYPDPELADDGHLGRLTIRTHNLIGPSEEIDTEIDEAIRRSYVCVLHRVLRLPVIELAQAGDNE